MNRVVDTNVLIVANKASTHATPGCVSECARTLQNIMREGVIYIDDDFRILNEYTNNIAVTAQPLVGSQFLLWTMSNRGNPSKCAEVQLTETDPPRLFLEFPDDPDLEGFDLSDRKFAAVAAGSDTSPTVVNATDSDWWHFQEPLTRNGIRIDFLCPELMPDT